MQQVYMLSECAAFCCRFLITSSALWGGGGAHQAYAVCDAPLASEIRKQKGKKKKQSERETQNDNKTKGTCLDYSIPCRIDREATGVGSARGISTAKGVSTARGASTARGVCIARGVCTVYSAQHELVEYYLQLSTPRSGSSLQGILSSNRKLAQMCNGLALALAYVRQPFTGSPPSCSYIPLLHPSLSLCVSLSLVTLSTSSWLT